MTSNRQFNIFLRRVRLYSHPIKNRPDEFFQSNIFYFLVHPSEVKLDDSNGPTGRPRPGWPTMDNKMLGDLDLLFYISNQVMWLLEAHRRRLIGRIGFQHFEFGNDEILECDREDKNIDLLGSKIGLKCNASQKDITLPLWN